MAGSSESGFAHLYICRIDGLEVAPPIFPLVEITRLTISPTNLTDAKHEYETHLGLGYWGDAFTISITVSNFNDFDIWVRPDYSLGKLTGEPLGYVEGNLVGFTPYPLLYVRLLLDTAYMQGDYSYWGANWQELYDYQNKGSNMSQFVYDPDGNAVLEAGADCWMKVPAREQATTVKEGHLGIEDHDLLPGTFDLCAVVTGAFYLVWDPHYRTVGGVQYLINYSPVMLEPAAAALSEAVYIERTVFPPPPPTCPQCGSTNITCRYVWGPVALCTCNVCGHEWYESPYG
jgi:hypothetical protein